MSTTMLEGVGGSEELRPFLNWFDCMPRAHNQPQRLRDLNQDRLCYSALYDVAHDSSRGQYKLVHRCDASREMVFTLVGVVHRHDYPGEELGASPNQRETGISISGLGSGCFLEAKQATNHLYDFMSSHFHPADFVMFNKTSGPEDDALQHRTIRARGYWLIDDRSNALTHVPYNKTEDPYGYLATIQKNNPRFKRTSENVVKIVDGRPSAKNQSRKLPPSFIRPDDLVELEVAPLIEHSFANIYFVVLHLRSIKLLHRFYTVHRVFEPLRNNVIPASTELTEAEYRSLARDY